MTTLPDKKRCLYAQAKVLARTFCLCSTGCTPNVVHQNYFISNILWSNTCTLLVFGANLKIWTWKALLLHTITVSKFYLTSRCSANFMFASNYSLSFNECIHSSIFSLLCRLHQTENPLFVNYFHTDIHFRRWIHIKKNILTTHSILFYDLFIFISHLIIICYLTCTP